MHIQLTYACAESFGATYMSNEWHNSSGNVVTRTQICQGPPHRCLHQQKALFVKVLSLIQYGQLEIYSLLPTVCGGHTSAGAARKRSDKCRPHTKVKHVLVAGSCDHYDNRLDSYDSYHHVPGRGVADGLDQDRVRPGYFLITVRLLCVSVRGSNCRKSIHTTCC